MARRRKKAGVSNSSSNGDAKSVPAWAPSLSDIVAAPAAPGACWV